MSNLDMILIRPRIVTAIGMPSPRVQPPDPIAFLANYLLRHGYKIEILDLLIEDYDNVETIGNVKLNGLDDKEAAKRILNKNPLSVGINFEFSTDTLAVKLLVKALRGSGYQEKIILGGTNASVLAGQILGDTDYPHEIISGVDIVVNNRNVGGGELSLAKLLDCLKSNSNLNNVPGISYRQGDQLVTTNSLSCQDIENVLSEIDGPARHLYEQKKGTDIYSWHNNPFSGHVDFPPFGTLFTSRGCPYSCTFCLEGKDTPGFVKGWMRRSIEKIFKEVDLMVEERIKTILIQDENFGGYNNDHIVSACDILKYIAQKKIKAIYFPNAVTIQSLLMDNFKLLKLMDSLAKSGLKIRLSIPVESGSDEVLKMMRKPHTVEMLNQVFNFIDSEKMLNNDNFEVETWAIVGNVGNKMCESLQQVYITIKYMEDLTNRFEKLETYICFTKPVPGTEMYERLKQQKEFNPDLMFEHQPYGIWGSPDEEKRLYKLVMEFNRNMDARRRRPMFPDLG